MKAKNLSLAGAALLAVGGLWFGWSAWHSYALQESSPGAVSKGLDDSNSDPDVRGSGSKLSQAGPNDGSKRGQALKALPRLAPPDPTRRFVEFTPEQRVDFARRGTGPGG